MMKSELPKRKTPFPRMTVQLLGMVLTEVIYRLSTGKRAMLNEPLEQIVLNKYTVIKFTRLEKQEEKKARS